MPLAKQILVDAGQWMMLPQEHLPPALKLADLNGNGSVDSPEEFERLYDIAIGSDELVKVVGFMQQSLVSTPESLGERTLYEVKELKPVYNGLGRIIRTRGVSAGTLAIQEALNEISVKLSDYSDCGVGIADGMYGGMTEAGVKAFQSVQPSLPVTGMVNAIVLKKLDEILERARSVQVNAIEDIKTSPTVEPRRPKMITYGDRFGTDCVLTFDDGPVPNTAYVLDALKAANITGATFFVQGINAKRFPDMLRRIVAEGHVLGNHTYDHPNLRTLNAESIRSQINRCQDAVNEALGYEYPMTQMRPPYGAINDTGEAVLAEMGLSLLLWQVDSNDWRPENKRHLPHIVHNVCSGTYSLKGGRGGVILLHDIHRTTGTVLPDIIHEINAQGYRFTTVDALLKRKYG
ncbi:MAG: polysaccharide deacetylase family protein [Cyanobacteria bacterium P01_F01_bin.150]